MKVKIITKTLTIWLWLILWLFVASFIRLIDYTYHTYAPITNFIDFRQLDLADYTKWDEFQMVYAYRNSKIETVWNFTFKTFCNWVSLSERNQISEHVLLQKTNWLEKITIKARVTNDLPVWECKVYTHIDLDVHWYLREIKLQDTFNVK